jgi:hypothetical protein
MLHVAVNEAVASQGLLVPAPVGDLVAGGRLLWAALPLGALGLAPLVQGSRVRT